MLAGIGKAVRGQGKAVQKGQREADERQCKEGRTRVGTDTGSRPGGCGLEYPGAACCSTASERQWPSAAKGGGNTQAKGSVLDRCERQWKRKAKAVS